MKKINIFFVALVFIGLSAGAAAQTSGSCGTNLAWALTGTGSNLTLTISGTGAMTDYLTPAPWYSQAANIKTLVLPNGITTIGDEAFDGCNGLTGALIIPDSVTSIGQYAFALCSGFTTLVIPNSVTIVKNAAFTNCKGLTSVTIGNSVAFIYQSAFLSCIGLTNVINLSITPQNINVNSNVFYGVDLSSVTLTVPACVLSNYQNADVWSDFGTITGDATLPYYQSGTCGDNLTWTLTGDCDSLALTISGTGDMDDYTLGNAPWFSQRFNIKTLVLEDGITHIGDYAFALCPVVTGTLIIPNTVTSIGQNAFNGISYLTGLTIGSAVATIGNWAFEGCTRLTKVTNLSIFPQNIESGGITAFGNPSLIDLSPDTLVVPACALSNYQNADVWSDFGTIIGDATLSPYYQSGICGGLTLTWTLAGCSSDNLTLTISGTGDMDNYILSMGADAPWYSQRTNIKTLILEDGITSISGYAFESCYNITALTIPNSVQSIGDNAFSNCYGLTGTLTIPNSVTTIGQSAFEMCKYLTGITIGNSVATIGDNAFKECLSLTGVTNLSTTPQSINSNVFDYVDLSSATLTVPACALSDYQNADVWNTFGAIAGDETLPCGDNGIKTVKAGNITIYPNPVKDELKVESGELKINNVEIADLAGKIIINCQLSIVNSINVSSLPKGVYLVKINTDKGAIVRKVVKD